MIFCKGEGKYERKGIGYQQNLMIFNEKVKEDMYNETKTKLNSKKFKLPVDKWVDIKDIESPTTNQIQLGGYLKTLSYKTAWKEMWSELSHEDKEFFGTLPNFNAEIFEAITGVEYDLNDRVELKVDGEVTFISRESAKALNLIK